MTHINRETDTEAEAARLIAEAYSKDAPTATTYRDITPAHQTGTPPVAQPGRPPMSQRATDHATLVATYSLGSLPVGAATSLVLWSLSALNPATLAIAATAPPALVIAAGITARLIGHAMRDSAAALPRDQHHHYEGPTHIQHTTLHTTTRGLGRTTNTQLPGEVQQ